MNNFNQKIITSPQKNFDINLKVNFQSGYVSVGLPQNFKKSNQPYVYSQPSVYNNNISIPSNINNHIKLFSDGGSIAETVNIVDCVICGKSYSENQFQKHIQFHKNRNNQNYNILSDKKQLTQRSASQYTFQPQKNANLNSSTPSIYDLDSQNNKNILQNSIHNSSLNSSFQCKSQSQHIGNINNAQRSSVYSLNNSNKGMYVERQNNSIQFYSIPHLQKIQTYSVPDPRQMNYYQHQSFQQNQQFHNFLNKNVISRSQANPFLMIRRQIIPDKSFNNQMKKIQNYKYQSVQNNNSQKQQDQISIHSKKSLKQSNKNSQTVLNSNNNQKIKYNEISLKKSQKSQRQDAIIVKNNMSNSLYNSFKCNESDSQDQDNQFIKGKQKKEKIILQRLSSNEMRNLKLFQSGISQAGMSDKSRSSKAKIPLNYLAREQFIENSVGNSSIGQTIKHN